MAEPGQISIAPVAIGALLIWPDRKILLLSINLSLIGTYHRELRAYTEFL